MLRVGPGEAHQTVSAALSVVPNASADKRCAILVAAGNYTESGLRMKAGQELKRAGAPPLPTTLKLK